MTLPSHTMRAIDVLRLEEGVSYGPTSRPYYPYIHHSEPYVLLIVHPDGRTTLNDVQIELKGPLPWDTKSDSGRVAPILVRPMPGATYANVVAVIDWIRDRARYEEPVGHIHLVRCEPDPELWDVRDDRPPVDPVDRIAEEPAPEYEFEDIPLPDVLFEDMFIPDPP